MLQCICSISKGAVLVRITNSKVRGQFGCNVLKEVSYDHQSCIYLIKNKFKTVILSI